MKARAEKQAFSTHPEPFAPYPTDRGSGLQRQLRGQRHANCAMHDCARARGNGDNCLHIIYIYILFDSATILGAAELRKIVSFFDMSLNVGM